MGIVVAVLCVLVAGLAAVLVAFERQLRRVARRLAEDEGLPRDVRLALRTPGFVDLAQTLNGIIDDAGRAAVHAGEERRRLQQDLAAFSHDVRTPLTGAQGYLQLYAVADGAAERDRCVTEASERLTAMRRMIDQLFDLTKVEGGRYALQLEPLFVDEVLAECLAGLYPAFAQKGWSPEVLLDEGVRGLADREALSRVFENLLANCLCHGTEAPTVCLRRLPLAPEPQFDAVASAPAGLHAPSACVPVSLHASAACAPADAAALPSSVAADGAASSRTVGWELVLSNRAANLRGLDFDMLFERFYRGDPSRGSTGSGLGLAIARGLSSAMGLQLTARADLACETFVIVLRGA